MPISGTRHLSIGGGVARAIKFQPDANCVLWTPGQDDPQSAVIRDRSGQGNDGAITGCLWVRTSKGTWVQNFDGDDEVNVANDASLMMGTQDFTYKMWVNFVSYANAHQFLLAHRSTADWFTFDVLNTGKLSLEYTGGAHFEHPTVITTNVWHHAIATRRGGFAYLYLDAVEHDPTLDLSAVNALNATILRIGGTSWGWSCICRIGLTVYDVGRGWTATEVAGNYNQERHLFGV